MVKCSTAVSFPDNAKLNVDPAVAREILAAAERLPSYDNREFYSNDLQTHVLNSVRESCPEAFDEVTNAIKDRLDRWPYCALVQGLDFDAMRSRDGPFFGRQLELAAANGRHGCGTCRGRDRNEANGGQLHGSPIQRHLSAHRNIV